MWSIGNQKFIDKRKKVQKETKHNKITVNKIARKQRKKLIRKQIDIHINHLSIYPNSAVYFLPQVTLKNTPIFSGKTISDEQS